MIAKQLAERLARFTVSGTLSAMDVRDQITIVDCINASVYNWFAAVPERYRITTVSHLIRPPLTTTATMTSGGNVVGGLVAEDYMLGASIIVGSEVNMNEIISTTDGVATLLNEFRGDTGTHPATIYFDTIMLTNYNVSRITNHPRILDTGVKLVRDDDGLLGVGAERRGAGHGVSAGQGIFYGASISRELGSPYRYTIENTGMSQLDEARIMLRLDPLPITEATIQFDAAIDAATLGLSDLDNDTILSVPDQYIIPHVLPMAKAELAESEIWANENTRQIALQRGAGASIIPKITQEVLPNTGTPQNRVRTRKGW